MRINKLMRATDCKDLNVVDIKNHLVDLYQRVGIHLLRKHQQFQEKLQTCNSEWQVTCDQLINETQSLKQEREKVDSEHQALVFKLTTQLNELKTEHYKIQQTNEENTAKLKSELSNSLNVHYLKNILSSYFTTTDTTVQQNLLKVVFNVLKYSAEEQRLVMEKWSEHNKSTF